MAFEVLRTPQVRRAVEQQMSRRLARIRLGVTIDAPVLWSPLHQGLPDILAGTAVLIDR